MVRSRRSRYIQVALGAMVLVASGRATRLEAAALFADADASTLVVRGRVKKQSTNVRIAIIQGLALGESMHEH